MSEPLTVNQNLRYRKRGTYGDDSVWNECLRSSHDHGQISRPIINHLMEYYGISRERAIELAKERARSINRMDKDLGKDRGAYQQ